VIYHGFFYAAKNGHILNVLVFLDSLLQTFLIDSAHSIYAARMGAKQLLSLI
jgi:hypothetical protein